MPGTFDRVALTTAGSVIPDPDMFMFNLFYGGTANIEIGEVEDLDVDVELRSETLASFVGKSKPSKMIDALGKLLRSYEIPIMSEMELLDPAKLRAERQTGETIYITQGEAQAKTQAARADAYKMSVMKKIDNRIKRRWEWLAARSLVGSAAYTDDNYAFLIDYLIPAANKPVLAGAFVWGGVTPDIPANFLTWKDLAAVPFSVAVMDPLAGALFMADADVRAEMAAVHYDAGTLIPDLQARFQGVYKNVLIFIDGDKYDSDGAGTKVGYIPDNTVIFGNPELADFRPHAVVVDDPETMEPIAAPIVFDEWAEKNPKGRFVRGESKMLCIPHNPDTVVVATVA